MLYAIIATDRQNSQVARTASRPRHLAYIKPLMDAGRIVVAGPHPAIDIEEPTPAGVTGSLIVAEFASLEEAQAWVAADPYVLDGIFANIQIKPFVQVLP